MDSPVRTFGLVITLAVAAGLAWFVFSDQEDQTGQPTTVPTENGQTLSE